MTRHERRAVAAKSRAERARARKLTDPPFVPLERKHVLALVPSYHGASIETIKNLFAIEDVLRSQGHLFSFDGIGRTPLDLARNENATKFLSSNADIAIFMDDDCQVDPEWLGAAVEILGSRVIDDYEASKVEILSAPCRLRQEKIVFNIAPCDNPVWLHGMRIMECIWTGLGCVLVTRNVIEKMFDVAKNLQYQSWKTPGATSCALFKSEVVPVRILQTPDEDPEARVYVLDDRVFSLRAKATGFSIWAGIDAETCHDGLKGVFGETLDAYEASKVSDAEASKAYEAMILKAAHATVP